MPKYYYTARDKDGKKVTGSLSAENEDKLAQKLSLSGYMLVSVKGGVEKLSKKKYNIKLGLSKTLDITQRLGALLKGGLTLLAGLNALLDDTKEVELYTLLVGLRNYVEAGGSFHGALALYPLTFSKLYVSMIKSAEESGELNTAIQQVADYLEWQLELRAKITELTVYPVIISTLMVLVVSLLVGIVIPKFEVILKDLNTELPLPTQIVLSMSHVFVSSWWIFAIIIAVLVVALKFLSKKPKIKFIIDRVKLRIPVFGDLVYKICILRFARSMALSLSSGVRIIDALELGSNIIGNEVLAQGVRRVKESTTTGGQLSVGFNITNLFPSMLVRMVEVGERSGNLVEGFNRVVTYYDKDVPRVVKKIFSIVEPMIIMLMGVIVGGIAISVFLPLIKMTEKIGA